jgi:hypothetical protein
LIHSRRERPIAIRQERVFSVDALGALDDMGKDLLSFHHFVAASYGHGLTRRDRR